MRTIAPTLVVDPGTETAAAMVVSDQGTWLVPDPASGEARWRNRVQIADLFAAMRAQAEHQVGALTGPVTRAVVTVPASLRPGDPQRGRLVAAAEAAGFTAVELLLEPAGALWAPGSPVQIGEVVLVCHLGATFEAATFEAATFKAATFEAAVVRAGDDLPEILGHASIVDWPVSLAELSPQERVELTVACCRGLLERAGLPSGVVRWVLPVGGGARTAGLAPALEYGLGIAVAYLEEPELAVVRGSAHWLPRSGPRTVMARPAPERMMPLVFTIPGGSARLLRWLVSPEDAFGPGTPLARVRLAGGAVWDLTARSRGTIDQLLVEGGSSVTSGEWLALTRHE